MTTHEILQIDKYKLWRTFLCPVTGTSSQSFEVFREIRVFVSEKKNTEMQGIFSEYSRSGRIFLGGLKNIICQVKEESVIYSFLGNSPVSEI